MTTRSRIDVEEARADTTPMIDVVFLMIVFFVCIDFRVLEAKLPAFLPKDHGVGSHRVEPQEQLVVRVHTVARGERHHTDGDAGSTNASGRPARFQLRGHRVAWQIGPRTFDELHLVQQELQRLAADPGSLVPDPATGGRKRVRCVVEGDGDTCYADIATAADACHAAGFGEIEFGFVPTRRG